MGRRQDRLLVGYPRKLEKLRVGEIGGVPRGRRDEWRAAVGAMTNDRDDDGFDPRLPQIGAPRSARLGLEERTAAAPVRLTVCSRCLAHVLPVSLRYRQCVSGDLGLGRPAEKILRHTLMIKRNEKKSRVDSALTEA